MICEGGLLAAQVHSVHRHPLRRIVKQSYLAADERGIHENLDHYDMDAFSMHAKR